MAGCRHFACSDVKNSQRGVQHIRQVQGRREMQAETAITHVSQITDSRPVLGPSSMTCGDVLPLMAVENDAYQ